MNMHFKRLHWIVLIGLSLTVHQNIYSWGFSFSPRTLGFFNNISQLVRPKNMATVGTLTAATLAAAGLTWGCYRGIKCLMNIRARYKQERLEQERIANTKREMDRYASIQIFNRINNIVANKLPSLADDEFGYIEAKVLPAGSRIAVIGDVHGDFQSITNDLQALMEQGIIDCAGRVRPGNYIVCLGDLADRGPHGVRVWEKMLDLKNLNPDSVWILRGNHEDAEMAPTYGFLDELIRRFRTKANDVLKAFAAFWKKLPQAVYLGMRNPTTGKVDYIQFCHGGIETRLNNYVVSALRGAMQYDIVSRRTFKTAGLCDREEPEVMCGLNWSDFCATDKAEPCDIRCERALNMKLRTYNAAFARNYLRCLAGDDFNVHCIVRGHDHVPGGIVELRDQIVPTEVEPKLQQWRPLQHDHVEPIRQGAVFTCTSSPAALGVGPRSHNCHEDAFAVIDMGATGLQIRPHIVRR